MKKLRTLGKVYMGRLPRNGSQSLEDYFRKVLSPYENRTGLILWWPKLQPHDLPAAIDTWHKVQDQIFN